LRAVGGREAVASVHSRRLRGTYNEGSLHATTDMAWQRPALRRVNVHAPGFDYAEGFDGSTWEMDLSKGVLVRDTGAAADAGRRGAEFDESFIDYRAKGHTVAFDGLDTLEQRPVYRVRVTLADGWEKTYYFDMQTHLIVALRKAMPVHATGPKVTSLTYYDDWARDGPLLQAHTFVEREAASGRVMNTLHWDRIEINPSLEPSELRPPDRVSRPPRGIRGRELDALTARASPQRDGASPSCE